METTTNEGCTLTPLDRASFQLQNTIIPHSHQQWLFIFASDEQESECCTRKHLLQWRRPSISQLLWRRRCQEGLARISILHCPAQMGPIPDCTVAVVKQSSQTLQRAPWYGAWHYHVAGERLSSSLAWLWKFGPSGESTSRCSGWRWWFPGHNTLICADELLEALLIPSSSVWPP
jgi:hypothetical protein